MTSTPLLPDLQRLFAVVKMETLSSLGSPTAVSPRLSRYSEAELAALLEAARVAQARRRPQ